MNTSHTYYTAMEIPQNVYTILVGVSYDLFYTRVYSWYLVATYVL